MTIPAGLAENPEIPRPVFPGLERATQQVMFDAYVAALRAPDSAEKVGDLGMFFHRLGSAVEAVQCFSRCDKLEPKSLRWKYFLAIAYDSSFDVENAIKTLKEAEQIDPNYPGVVLRLADGTRKRDTKAARVYYERAFKLTPNDSRIYYGLGQCDLAEGKKDAAMAAFKKALEFAPKHADAHLALAGLYEQAGEKKQADASRMMAEQGGQPPVLNDPLFLDLLIRLARPEAVFSITRQYMALGQTEQAIEILRRAIATLPNDWNYHFQLGMILSMRGKPEEAVAEFRSVLQGDPSRPHIRTALAQALSDSGQFSEAEQLLKQEADRLVDDADAHGRYANFLLRMGKSEQAAELLQKLIQMQPDQSMHEIGLIIALLGQNKHDAAAARWKLLQRHARGDRNPTDAFINQACMLMVEQGKADPTGFRKECLSPKDFALLAEKLDASGVGTDARKVRDYVESIGRNAEVLADHGEFKQAIRLLQLVMPADRGGVLRDAMRVAFAAMRKRDAPLAESFMRDSTAHASESAELSMVLAWILATDSDASLRNGVEAVRLAEQACTLTKRQNPEALDTLAAAYAEIGKFDEAVKAQQAALTIAPTEGCAELAQARYKQRLALYEAKQPFHASR